jgi:Biotin/lipoate A/B protein ligase family
MAERRSLSNSYTLSICVSCLLAVVVAAALSWSSSSAAELASTAQSGMQRLCSRSLYSRAFAHSSSAAHSTAARGVATSQKMCASTEAAAANAASTGTVIPLPPLAVFVWSDAVNSTMDAARSLIASHTAATTADSASKSSIHEGVGVIAIGASKQINGRGTRGRSWVGYDGNLFLTVAVPQASIPVPLSLTPLRIGTLLAPDIMRRVIKSGATVTLKWPNDVLIGNLLFEWSSPCASLISCEGITSLSCVRIISVLQYAHECL